MLRILGRQANRTLKLRSYAVSAVADGPVTSNPRPNRFRKSAIEDLLKQNKLDEASKEFMKLYQPEKQSFSSRQINPPEGFKTLYNALREAALNGKKTAVTPREVFDKLLAGKMAFGWMCANLIQQAIVKNSPHEGLEIWVKYLETSGMPAKVTNRLTNREAAVSAFVSYICSCLDAGAKPEAEVAKKIVPLDQFPLSSEISRIFRGPSRIERLPEVLEQARLIRIENLDFNSASYLQSLPHDRPTDLEEHYSDCCSKGNMNDIVYSRFISSFADGSRVQRSFDIWNDMQRKEVAPTINSWNALLKAGCLNRSDRMTIAEGIWAKMIEHGVEPDANSYSILLDMYFRNGKVAHAFEAFEKLQRDAPSMITLRLFNVVVNGLATHNHFDDAQKLIEEFSKKEGFILNVTTYNSLLTVAIKEDKYELADKILRDMKKDHVSPDVVTYTILIDQLYKSSRATDMDISQDIENLLQEMSSAGIKSNTQTMTAIVDGLVRNMGDVSAARNVYNVMQNKNIKPNQHTFSTLLWGEFRYGSEKTAERYFKEMANFGLFYSTAMYNQMIQGFALRSNPKAVDYFEACYTDPKTKPNKFSYYFALTSVGRDTKLSQKILDYLATEPSDFEYGDQLPSVIKKLSATEGINIPASVQEALKL